MKSVILTAVIAVLLQGANPGIIICADGAGHLEVESVGDGCCCMADHSGGQPGKAPSAALANPSSACADCTDTIFPLSVSVIRTERGGEGSCSGFFHDALTLDTISGRPETASTSLTRTGRSGHAGNAPAIVRTISLLI